jgi:hypothetical protein
MAESNMYLRGETWFLRAEIAGKKYRESLHTANVREARKLRDDRLKAIRPQARHGTVDWQKAVVAWAEHAEGQIAPRTFKRYLQSLNTCGPYLVGRVVGAVDGEVIRSLVKARRRVASIATLMLTVCGNARSWRWAIFTELCIAEGL